ncbi:TBC1 domain family member 15-like isoform X2 [Mizuhopecten yessoensis]|uniref:TBC1 domain family member 15 n=1 Tax=Mizuhopecten yessoensis TaxID=6573 RepID=A0A210Q8D9_MIZYE|nr:TBC1 domain family member 15-like isoform X2 [Mizuhopecten yessoensis]OWF45003.1 TBC1 domain family member 15 [Mizuhopecten yessoensis]
MIKLDVIHTQHRKMASQSQVLFERDGVYIHVNVNSTTADKDAHIPGRVYLAQKPEGSFIEWKAEDVQSLDSNQNDQEWAVIGTTCSVGYKPDKDNVVSVSSKAETRKRYNVSFDILDLKSFKRNAPNHGWAYIIFILKDGTTYPALHFHSGGSKALLQQIGKYLHIKRSPNDSRLFIVQEHDPDMLSKSFDELHLFSESSAYRVTKFINDPYTTALGGFAKVTNFLRDSIMTPENVTSRPKEEVAEILQEDIPGMEISQQVEAGFEVVTKTKLPNRPEVTRGQPLNSQQWSKHMDRDGQIKDVEHLKDVIFRGGVEPCIRNEVWKFLLNYYDWQSTYKTRADERKRKVDDYFRMKLQWKTINDVQENRFSLLKERKCLIEKDVTRTDRTHKFFEGECNPNLQVLNDILMTYCMYNFDLGYVQGMSDLLSPILVVMENEVDAFWCFAGLMDKVWENFEMDQKGMKCQLADIHRLMQFSDPELCSYLESHDSGNFYFCFRWLLIFFKREFSFSDVQRLWEVIWTERPCKSFHLVICLAILDTEKTTLIENKFGFTEILKHINDMSLAIHLEETLKKAESIFLQLKNSKKLPATLKEILGMELSPSSSTSSSCKTTPIGTPINRESTPKLELPFQGRENGLSAPSSGSGTAVTTPDDSSLEILTDNADTAMNLVYN